MIAFVLSACEVPKQSAPVGITEALTPEQRKAIGEHVRACWTKAEGAAADYQVALIVTTDHLGTARRAVVSKPDADLLHDNAYREFVERAIRAVMDVRCADLPIPSNLLGRNTYLSFRFSK